VMRGVCSVRGPDGFSLQTDSAVSFLDLGNTPHAKAIVRKCPFHPTRFAGQRFTYCGRLEAESYRLTGAIGVSAEISSASYRGLTKYWEAANNVRPS